MTHRRTGDDLLAVLGALDNPHRLRIIGSLRDNECYVSELARQLGLSRPLTHMHLGKLEDAGLVTSRLEFSADGKALRYYCLAPFEECLTADVIADAIRTLTLPRQEGTASK
jgi:predicted transcriptional regulator